jgi:hypothetical protein
MGVKLPSITNIMVCNGMHGCGVWLQMNLTLLSTSDGRHVNAISVPDSISRND